MVSQYSVLADTITTPATSVPVTKADQTAKNTSSRFEQHLENPDGISDLPASQERAATGNDASPDVVSSGPVDPAAQAPDQQLPALQENPDSAVRPSTSEDLLAVVLTLETEQPATKDNQTNSDLASILASKQGQIENMANPDQPDEPDTKPDGQLPASKTANAGQNDEIDLPITEPGAAETNLTGPSTTNPDTPGIPDTPDTALNNAKTIKAQSEARANMPVSSTDRTGPQEQQRKASIANAPATSASTDHQVESPSPQAPTLPATERPGLDLRGQADKESPDLQPGEVSELQSVRETATVRQDTGAEQGTAPTSEVKDNQSAASGDQPDRKPSHQPSDQGRQSDAIDTSPSEQTQALANQDKPSEPVTEMLDSDPARQETRAAPANNTAGPPEHEANVKPETPNIADGIRSQAAVITETQSEATPTDGDQAAEMAAIGNKPVTETGNQRSDAQVQAGRTAILQETQPQHNTPPATLTGSHQSPSSQQPPADEQQAAVSTETAQTSEIGHKQASNASVAAPKGDAFSKLMANVQTTQAIQDPATQTDSNVKPDASTPMQADTSSIRLSGMESLARTGQVPSQVAAANAQAIVAHISKFASKGETRFEIRLDPSDLGKVDVRLTIGSDGQTRAHLFVEKTETLDFLMRDQRVLERSLTQNGLNLDRQGLEFSLMDQRDQQQHAAHQQAEESDQTGAGQDRAHDDELPASTIQPHATNQYVASNGINLVI